MSAAVAAVHEPVQLGTNDQLLRTTAWSLRSLMRTTDQLAQGTSLRSNFAHIIPASQTLPTIEVFVHSITASLSIKPAVLVTALIYVERLGSRLPKSATGTADTPYRIFLSALLLADKYWSDHSVVAKSLVGASGGLFQQREICAMERALLKFLGFNLFVSAEEIRHYAEKLSIDLGSGSI
ncbi:hypothetical protein GQ54DRAFT_295039 [Martensiomyces pterosporus]|nr:hypothetical protein GQ54DRAFT_295039 [Martensiomyces pterosporus]